VPAPTARRRNPRRRPSEGRRRDAAPTEARAAATAEARAQARAALGEIRFPDELPVSQRREEIAAAIRDHQVVVVAGETGSGKTTQLPKICLELGRGSAGLIGHTQPRRLAARTVSERIAAELGVELGAEVGYAVRFTDEVRDRTLVKLMTDGILLAELPGDRDLRAYDTIIVDEAHERSLNIDFLLGYLAQLLPRRPDLKVVITSATIETERFAAHFGGAPIVEVSGRTYPVELRYRPLDPSEHPPTTDDDVEPAGPSAGRAPARQTAPAGAVRDQITAILDAVDELGRESPGDILVFLSGEREIRDTADALAAADLPETEVVPLYARLSLGEQHRVFAPHRGRRIVLATNVAETSLTVPGIRYVVDAGTARISRYSARLKVQRLPIEPVSQASANQRAGRCGRVADGICVRLYSEEDLTARPAYTDPEILRTNLASVILQMTSIGLGDIEAFPFLDPPDRRAIGDGVRLLDELGALDATATTDARRLTPMGRRLARLPIEPRFGRMVLAAGDEGCLREVLIIAAALSIQDPRERPADQLEEADRLHRRFDDPTSDFLAFVHLWDHLRTEQRRLSGNQFRRLCRRELLNHLRVREWQDVHSQLRRIVGDLGLRQNSAPAEPDAVHRALLAGLLSHVGQRLDRPDGGSAGREGGRDGARPRGGREYLGARSARFVLGRESSLARKQPEWVMAAELVETNRLWARTVARIEPQWIEPIAGHLVKRHHSEPHWSSRRAEAMVHERVTLYGLPVVADRTVSYARIDPEHARELFIRHALVEGDWRTSHAFVTRNRALLDDLEEIEHRFRRRDLVAGSDALEALYAARVPAEVTSARRFDAWWKRARQDDPDRLTFTVDDLLRGTEDLDEADFPAEWRQGDLLLGLSYAFEPGTLDDGVAVHIPIGVLNQVSPEGFDWQVPGLRRELVDELVRSLPKHLRRTLVPVPGTVSTVLERVGPSSGPLLEVLADELRRIGGEPIAASDFDTDRLPPHLRMAFVVVADEDPDRVLAQGRDLDRLRAALVADVRRSVAALGSELDRDGVTTWTDATIGALARTVERTRHGVAVRGYPALVDQGDGVGVRVLDSPGAQAQSTWDGTRRLLRLAGGVSRKAVMRALADDELRALKASPYASVADLYDDVVMAVLDDRIERAGGPPWDAAGFTRLQEAVAEGLGDDVLAGVRLVARILATVHALDRRLGDPLASTARAVPVLVAADVVAQRDGLVYDGFVSAVGVRRLADVARYLDGAVVRLERVADAPQRDRERMDVVRGVQARYDELLVAWDTAGGELPDAAIELAWTIEELRISLFAQELGTAEPVSPKRVLAAIAAARP
jgi:ATP-dependent helicase HrpA